jgi:hypothetical protein
MCSAATCLLTSPLRSMQVRAMSGSSFIVSSNEPACTLLNVHALSPFMQRRLLS